LKKKELNVLSEEEFVTDEILVKFKRGVGKDKIDRINSKHGAFVRHTSPYTRSKRMGIPKGKTVAEMVKLYQAEDAVEYVEPNYIAHALVVPNDPLYSYQWHLDTVQYGGIEMEEAWEISTGSGVTVAVVDTGVAYENYGWRYKQAPDLAGTSFVQGYDFVNDDAHPNDDNSHGTHVTGTIAQTTDNNIGVAGVAFDCLIMPVKVLNRQGSGTYDQVAGGIYYAADNGAHVISLSLGGSADSETLKNAVKYAYENGVTVIAAAGNDASSIISYPAAYDDYVIAVGATRYDETLAYYSNYGTSLDLVAPGGDLTIDQNGDGYNDGVLQNTFNPNSKNTKDFGYWFFQGTSMATPHVSGVAALLIANGNAVIPDEVRSALQETAEDLGETGRDDTYGYGLVDAQAALQWTATPNTPPVANADGSYTGTEGVAVIFDGSDSYDPDGDPLTHTWNFGDGTTGTGVSPTHTYTTDGTYTVTLIVNDGKVDSDPSTTTATINDVGPVASFTSDSPKPEGEVMTFTDTSTSYDGITSWNWDFENDGVVDNPAQNPTHTYESAGTYTVKLIVSEADGDSSMVTKKVIVSAANQPPVADAGGPYTGNEGSAITFDASASYDPENAALTYEWDWESDGTYDVSTSSATIEHVWNDDYSGTVTFRVTDDKGKIDTDTASVIVNNVAPTAEAGGPYNGIVGEPITLTGSATDPGVDTFTYAWDLNNDGTYETSGQTATNTWSTAGTYTVGLQVTDDDGGVGTDTAQVTVTEAPSNTMHVDDITLSPDVHDWGRWFFARVTATISILDSSGSPVEGATVYGSWNGIYTGDVSGTTNSDGVVKFRTGWVREHGTFEFCVTNVAKEGWTYDATANERTCDSIEV
jgi:serine protease